jgi:hypothetical protein
LLYTRIAPKGTEDTEKHLDSLASISRYLIYKELSELSDLLGVSVYLFVENNPVNPVKRFSRHASAHRLPQS